MLRNDSRSLCDYAGSVIQADKEDFLLLTEAVLDEGAVVCAFYKQDTVYFSERERGTAL